MNVLVMVDIEGISGVFTREQVLPSESRFMEGRKYLTADVNACTKGLKAAGVDKVYVRDCHGGSYSLIWDEVSDDADYYICGDTAAERFCGAQDCDAVILLGYHAMAGTLAGVLEHSWSSKGMQNMYVNEVKVGEIALDAAVAGEHGMPVIMVSGDDKACAEAKRFLPDVVCAEVKKGTAINGAMLMPPHAAHELIFRKSMEAVENYRNCKMFSFNKPLNCRVEVTERTILPNIHRAPYVEILDGRNYKVYADSVEELIARAMSFT